MQKFILTSILLLICNVSFAFETNAKYAILMDYDTQDILFEKEAHTRTAPSSMSKMMTAYIAFEALKDGQVNLDDTYSISEKAWRMEGTRMFIPLNARVSFEDLLKGLIVQSGNDAAVTIAEILSGNEDEFAFRMNEMAEKLDMKNTNFTNASGLPDKDNYSSAYDLALLGRATIMDFPQYYHYYSQREFTYNNIRQSNRNGLLYRNIGADGIKTGNAAEAGYSVTASATKGKRRLIAVVNGLKTSKERTISTENLLNYGFNNFSNVAVAYQGQVFDKIKVRGGKDKNIELISTDSIILTVPKKNTRKMKATITYKTPAIAPIQAGDILGELIIDMPSANIKHSYNLTAKKSIEKSNFIGRIQENLSSFFD